MTEDDEKKSKQTDDRKWNQYAQTRWNPFTGDKMDDGKCEIVNRYGKMACWACSMAYRLRGRAGYDREDPFKPTFHPDKLDEPLKRKKPTIFATCFMGDIAYCKPEWMEKILDVIRRCPRHTFLMLTKLPGTFYHDVLLDKQLPDNVWMGTTVNRQMETGRIAILKLRYDCRKWVSFEPPFERIDCDLTGIDGIAIGALTGRHKFQPDPHWVDGLVVEARRCGTKVVLKGNLAGYETYFTEWP